MASETTAARGKAMTREEFIKQTENQHTQWWLLDIIADALEIAGLAPWLQKAEPVAPPPPVAATVIGHCAGCGIAFHPGSDGECFTICSDCWDLPENRKRREAVFGPPAAHATPAPRLSRERLAAELLWRPQQTMDVEAMEAEIRDNPGEWETVLGRADRAIRLLAAPAPSPALDPERLARALSKTYRDDDDWIDTARKALAAYGATALPPVPDRFSLAQSLADVAWAGNATIPSWDAAASEAIRLLRPAPDRKAVEG